ncbi:zinc finger, RING/FYVE/PHD-type [Artemisia annua]|uniref:Zinc finger, RING/FYVE/PHD-type n=1 Tax=Artemisia annua TaxID=35608 RepID=A0A2U1Q9F7_ARTAN|nr:zinc finger, RING/FYVE/PHD-type [Artemisia annua]
MNIPGNVLRYARGGSRRRKAGVPDLNVPLPVENLEHLASVALGVGSGIPVAHDGPGQEPAGFCHIILTLTVQIISVMFHIAEEIRISQAQANKRRRGPSNQPIINCELYVEGSSASVVTSLFSGLIDNVTFSVTYVVANANMQHIRAQPRYVAPPPPPPPPPVPEPVFNCPICLGPFVDSVTTKCGHIFCKTCIEASIKAKPSCPTCRRKLTMKNFFRVYLPTTK